MSHCSDEDLVLHHYGEDTTHERHLASCAECGARFRDLASVLQTLTAVETPERGEHYGIEVWQRIRHQLPEREPWWRAFIGEWQWAAIATAAVVLIAAGVAVGRLWPVLPAESTVGRSEAAVWQPDRRVLLLTVADHLERSDRMLTDIVNASGGADISTEQQWAIDLVASNRLYRQDATDTNEASVASVLDELERTLLEVVHRPSTVTATDLEEMRRRIDSAALLFKVRVMSDELRARELTEPAAEISPSIPSTIG